MDKEKQKAQKARVSEKEEPEPQWELTDEDRAFLLSCNISGE
jgi:hypothetical protein